MAVPTTPRGRARRATPLIGISLLAAGALSVQANGSVAPLAYFAVGPSVYAAPLDGASAAERITTISGSLGVRGLVLDPANGRMFTTRASNPAIEATSLTPGSAPSALPMVAPGLQNPSGITIDPSTGQLIWATEGSGGGDGNLVRAPFSGGGTTIATPSIVNRRPWGVAFSTATNTIYWTEYQGAPNGTIRWTRLDGSAGGTVATTGATVNAPAAVALSRTRQRLYWSNTFGISSAATGGGAGADIAVATFPRGIAVDDLNAHLYWAEYGPGTTTAIKRSDLDGQNITDVTPSGFTQDAPWGLSLLFPPASTATPTLAGAATVGQSLTCTAGAWAADAPESFAFRAPTTVSVQWVRDDQTITGATDATYRVTEAGRYACRAIAANAAGTTIATGDAITVPVPAIPPADPAVAVGRLTARWTLRGRAVTTTFRVPTGANRATITATRTGARKAIRGRCRLIGTTRARSATCTLGLSPGRWTATVTASRGNIPVSRATRAITVRTAR